VGSREKEGKKGLYLSFSGKRRVFFRVGKPVEPARPLHRSKDRLRRLEGEGGEGTSGGEKRKVMRARIIWAEERKIQQTKAEKMARTGQ